MAKKISRNLIAALMRDRYKRGDQWFCREAKNGTMYVICYRRDESIAHMTEQWYHVFIDGDGETARATAAVNELMQSEVPPEFTSDLMVMDPLHIL